MATMAGTAVVETAADGAAAETGADIAAVVPVMSAAEFVELASACTQDKHAHRGNTEQWLTRPSEKFVLEQTSGKGLKWDSFGNGLNPEEAIPVIFGVRKCWVLTC